jgi:hypothetical protein
MRSRRNMRDPIPFFSWVTQTWLTPQSLYPCIPCFSARVSFPAYVSSYFPTWFPLRASTSQLRPEYHVRALFPNRSLTNKLLTIHGYTTSIEQHYISTACTKYRCNTPPQAVLHIAKNSYTTSFQSSRIQRSFRTASITCLHQNPIFTLKLKLQLHIHLLLNAIVQFEV